MTTIPISPGRYRELSRPHESSAAFETALTAFFEDVRIAREKHRIPDVLVVVQANVLVGDGLEGRVGGSMYFGDSLMESSLAAWALGDAQRRMSDALAATLAAGRKGKG